MAIEEDIEKARKIADAIRTIWPEKAAEIERAIAAAKLGGNADGLKIVVSVKYRLEKFEGKYEPGKMPIETIEGEG